MDKKKKERNEFPSELQTKLLPGKQKARWDFFFFFFFPQSKDKVGVNSWKWRIILERICNYQLLFLKAKWFSIQFSPHI